jgi:hypothetical protein
MSEHETNGVEKACWNCWKYYSGGCVLGVYPGSNSPREMSVFPCSRYEIGVLNLQYLLDRFIPQLVARNRWVKMLAKEDTSKALGCPGKHCPICSKFFAFDITLEGNYACQDAGTLVCCNCAARLDGRLKNIPEILDLYFDIIEKESQFLARESEKKGSLSVTAPHIQGARK